MRFHEKSTRLRKECGWSQTDLGKGVDVYTAHLNRFENDKSQPSVEMRRKIACALSVTVV